MAILTIRNSSCVIPPVSYGLLYNWYAATDVRGISSSDEWIVPSSTEFTTLIDYLGGASTVGGKLKESGLTYWNTPNTGATNEVSFNGRGGGQRLSTSAGIFANLNVYGTYLMSNSAGASTCYGLNLRNNTETIGVGSLLWLTYKADGWNLRFVKTSTTLSDGETGTYVGNNGRIYPTICIGTQEWLAANLAETKYRTGDLIPEVTDNTAWAALTTGALCAYDNDWSYV